MGWLKVKWKSIYTMHVVQLCLFCSRAWGLFLVWIIILGQQYRTPENMLLWILLLKMSLCHSSHCCTIMLNFTQPFIGRCKYKNIVFKPFTLFCWKYFAVYSFSTLLFDTDGWQSLHGTPYILTADQKLVWWCPHFHTKLISVHDLALDNRNTPGSP